MFSPADVEALLGTLPSSRVQLDADDNVLNALEQRLVINSSKTGFVLSDHLALELARLLAEDKHSEKLQIEDVAKTLLVVPNEVLRSALSARAEVVLVTRDRKFIFTTAYRNQILERLYQMASVHMIDLGAFLVEHNIFDNPGLDLVSIYQNYIVDAKDLEDSLHYIAETKERTGTNRYIYTNRLRTTLKDLLQRKFQQAHNEARVCTIDRSEALGSPLHFLEVLAQECLVEGANSERHQGELAVREDVLEFQPHTYIEKSATETLKGLSTGEIPYVDFDTFERLRARLGLEATASNVNTTLLPHDKPRWAVSNSCLDRWQSEAQAILTETEYVRLGSLKRQLPENLEEQVYKVLAPKLLTKVSPALIFGDLVAEQSLHDRVSSLILSECLNQHRAQARTYWQAGEWKSSMKISTDIDELRSAIAASPQAGTHDIGMMTEILADEMTPKLMGDIMDAWSAVLEEGDQEFERFWTAKVVHRTQLYRLGLDDIKEPKLRDQLEEVLRSYIVEDLIPERLSKAKAELTLYNQQTIHEIQKLQEKLQKATSIVEIYKALDKFSNKLSKESPSDEDLDTAKQAHILDLQRGMRKDKDNARLFLTVVIVLLAKHKTGVVYATGRFAPKLMKLLKDHIDGDVYKELNELKEKVKAGSVTAEDRERMQALDH